MYSHGSLVALQRILSARKATLQRKVSHPPNNVARPTDFPCGIFNQDLPNTNSNAIELSVA